ncbi:MAG: uridine kinase [Chloroflexi bacterium]|nr:uridine kinase [Chloroflexota bacterium]
MSPHDARETTRQTLLDSLADRIASIRRPHPVRVAIDGVDAAGKTTLADELAEVIGSRGRSVVRASIDGFHRPRAERQQRGPLSPEGYYHDSFDYSALQETLLLPLGPRGSRRYRRAVFDSRADRSVEMPTEIADPDAVLLFDGVFLLRPELVSFWDLRVFVDVDFSVAYNRAMLRDLELFGTAAAVHDRYTRRYIPGQRLYLAAAQPRERADIVVTNDDSAHPVLIVRRTDSISDSGSVC